MEGKFVTIDGVDGAGKGTLIRIMKNYLLGNGYSNNDILITHEPSGTKAGSKIRELLREETDPSANATRFLGLYMQDREEHLQKEIIPALEAGKIVLCDRYKYSTIVYQSLQGIPMQDIIELHQGMLSPDLVIILDLPVSTALKRICEDGKRSGVEKFEKKEFLEKVRRAFRKLPQILADENILVIDASKPIEKVAEQAKDGLGKLLAGN